MTDRADFLALKDAVNATGALTITIEGVSTAVVAKSDFLDATAPAASVQQLPGARWADRYVDDSGTREQPFAVLLRTPVDDTAGRADGFAALMALATALEALTAETSGIDGFTSIAGTDTPVLTERADDGSEVWRATFMLVSDRSG